MVKKRILKIISRFRDPLFLLFIAVAFGVWFINKLNGTYIKDVVIPLYIEGVENPVQSGNKRYFQLFCRVRAQGDDLVILDLLPQSKSITIPITEVVSKERGADGHYLLNNGMLESAISNRLGKIELLKLHESNIRLKTLSYADKMVKVCSNITFDMKSGYMQVGETLFEPCSILVKGDYDKISSIDSVFTASKHIELSYNDILSEIELQKIDGVSFDPENVSYRVKIARYTEQILTVIPDVYIEDTVHSNYNEFLMIPNTVQLCFNVAFDAETNFEKSGISVRIDYNQDKDRGNYIGNNKYRVQVDNIPDGCRLIYVEPSYVTVVKNNI